MPIRVRREPFSFVLTGVFFSASILALVPNGAYDGSPGKETEEKSVLMEAMQFRRYYAVKSPHLLLPEAGSTGPN